MKALIPAAGEGTRLRPLTDEKPKALVEIGGKPLIKHLIDELYDLDVDEIYMITGYLGEKLEDNIKDPKIRFLEQEEQKGTAHAVGISSFDELFLVVNGDVFIHPQNLEKMIQNFETGEAKAVIGSKRVENPEEFGALQVDGRKVKGIVEKPENPPSNLINTGVYIFSPDIYEYIRRTGLSERGEYEITDSIQLMLGDGLTIKHTPFDRYWIDVGRPEDLEAARNLEI